MTQKRARRSPRRGISIDRILDEFIRTGVLSPDQEEKARKSVAEIKKERGNHGRRKSL